jgi:ribonuclease P protein component
MFSKAERLSRADFSRYYQVAKRYHATAFTLCYLPHPERKVSVVVGKKVAHAAVTRNRIKRQMYAQMRQLLQNETGIFIIITKPSIKQSSQSEIVNQLKEQHGRILKNP